MKSTSERYNFDNIDSLDEIGLPPVDYHGPCYNVPAVDKYCKANNTTADKLTEAELEPFIVGWR